MYGRCALSKHYIINVCVSAKWYAEYGVWFIKNFAKKNEQRNNTFRINLAKKTLWDAMKRDTKKHIKRKQKKNQYSHTDRETGSVNKEKGRIENKKTRKCVRIRIQIIVITWLFSLVLLFLLVSFTLPSNSIPVQQTQKKKKTWTNVANVFVCAFDSRIIGDYTYITYTHTGYMNVMWTLLGFRKIMQMLWK